VSELERNDAAPPVGEQIHMPASSVLPLVNAASLAFAIVSITISWFLVAFGVIMFVITAIKWIGDTRRDISELPLEHDEHH
jgi:Cytochrome c oxidase subunit IV